MPELVRYTRHMSDVTRLIEAAQSGDRQAGALLLPLVYEELRKLAAVQMANERVGHTLNATALVHEAYLRLVGDQQFEGRRHFFAAAAEAMRRILVECARRKQRIRHGGGRIRMNLEDLEIGADNEDQVESLPSISDALDQLAAMNSRAAELVKLRFFAGLTGRETAGILNISPRKADQIWAYARAWLIERLNNDSPG